MGREHNGIKLLLLLGICAVAAVLLSYRLAGDTAVPEWSSEGKNQPAAAEAAVSARLDKQVKAEIENCLPNVLAAEISADFGTETLRAQAVIARSLLYWLAAGNAGTQPDGVAVMSEEWLLAEGVRWRSEKEIGADMPLFRQAAADTEGYILMRQGEVILPLYHVCNAGRTRSGGDTLPYLTAQESGMDLLVAGSLRVLWLEPEDFAYSLSEAAGETLSAGQLGLTDGSGMELLEAEYDDAGYVLRIRLADELNTAAKEIDGEVLAKELGLPSAHYEWAFCDGQIRIACQGIGHGYGFSQWGAQALYEQGYGWNDLLNYYFPETEITKPE